MFIFSFEPHERCATPQRFVVKEKWKDDAGVYLYTNDLVGHFVRFDGGDGWFFLGNEKSDTWCVDLSKGFEGIENTTLTGNNIEKLFTCCRLVAIQLV